MIEDLQAGPATAESKRSDDLVWLALPPAAALTIAAIVWVARPLAPLVHPAPSWRPFPTVVQAGFVRPEPVEHTRFLLAVLAPFVLVAAGLALRWWCRSRQRTFAAAPGYLLAVQVAIAALVGVCWVYQKRGHEWFEDRTLLVGAGIGLFLLAMVRRGWLDPVGRMAAGRRQHHLIGTSLAVLLTGYWLLPAVFRTPNAVNLPPEAGQLFQIQFVQDELASVLSGRTPMVDFSVQYAKLLPFALAPLLAVLGPSIGVTTGLLAGLGLLALLAVYGTFTVLTGDGLVALVLYLPFLALSLFTVSSIGDERFNLATLFGVVPVRVLGPFVLAWLCARRLRRGGGAPLVLLFAGAGLVAVNNTEYGGASFAALGLALWCGHEGRAQGSARARRLAIQAAAGAVASVIAVCALTLLRSGSLPDPAIMSNLTRVFAVEGFGMEPMPTLGLHVVIYLTFVAALVSGINGAIRVEDPSPQDRVLHGLLAYSGLLGLGAGAYWAGRSHPLALFGMFPTWGLSVAVLTWAVLRAAAARPEVSSARAIRWALPACAVLTAYGLMATVVIQIPSPAAQARRLSAEGPDVPQYAARVEFITAHTVRGEPVAILAPVGHLLARDAGVHNVSPYASEASIAFYEQMDFVLDIMSRSGATKAFVGTTFPETSAYLAEKGYVAGRADVPSGLTAWQRAPGGA